MNNNKLITLDDDDDFTQKAKEIMSNIDSTTSGTTTSNPFSINTNQHLAKQQMNQNALLKSKAWPSNNPEFKPNVNVKRRQLRDLNAIQDKYTRQLLEMDQKQQQTSLTEEAIASNSISPTVTTATTTTTTTTTNIDDARSSSSSSSTPSGKVVICVKRKRDEDPIEEFYMEQAPKRTKTKHSVDTLTQMMNQTQLRDIPLKRFIFLDSSSDQNNIGKLKDQIQKRKMLKDVDLRDVARERKLQKFKQNVKNIRLLKVTDKRKLDDETRLVQVDLHVSTSSSTTSEKEEETKSKQQQEERQQLQQQQQQQQLSKKKEKDEEYVPFSLQNYASLLRENLTGEEYNSLMKSEQEEMNSNEYVYDYYYLDDPNQQLSPAVGTTDHDKKQKTVVQIERYDQDSIWYDNEYDDEEEDTDDYDSEDSNEEDHPNNDYPDEDGLGFDIDESEYDDEYLDSIRGNNYDKEFTGGYNEEGEDSEINMYDYIQNKYEKNLFRFTDGAGSGRKRRGGANDEDDDDYGYEDEDDDDDMHYGYNEDEYYDEDMEDEEGYY